nr:hypothetical protein [Sphingorhabdus profundilacus]
MQVDQQWHGYRRGHQLISSTIELEPRDQDLIDKLSDASGSPRPGEMFAPYLTVYPLPSGRFSVIARTWQDLNATRSGTVFTRSLLVPTELWATAPSVRPFFETLSTQDITKERAQIVTTASSWEPLNEPGLGQLVEALFLERAATLAAFGYGSVEEITGRLLQSLWPSRRASMAICTFALSPRLLPERDFDVVFAPDSARSRFTRWAGRKVNASLEGGFTRHEWTAQLQAHIFIDPNPSLRALDEIGALDAGDRNDGSALRLSLLWSDLRSKAHSSPTALLGMLDILSSLGRQPWSVPEVQGLIIRFLSESSSSPTPDNWRFVVLLVRKLGDGIPLSVIRSVFKAGRLIARSLPALVIRANDDVSTTTLPHLLRPPVAQGLADLDEDKFVITLRGCLPDVIVSLMKESPSFSTAVATSLNDDADAVLVKQIADLVAGDPLAAKRSIGGLAKGARSSIVAPLLRAAIQGAPASNFGLLARNVLAANARSRSAIIDTLIEASREMLQKDVLLREALVAPSVSEGDQIILELSRDRTSIKWLVDARFVHADRLSSLLLTIISTESDADLRELLREGRIKDALIEASLSGLPGSGKAFVRLLRLLPVAAPSAASLLRQARVTLSESEYHDASMQLLDQLLSLDPVPHADLLDPLLANAEPARLVSVALSTAFDGAQVGRNVAAIAQSKSVARFIPIVDQINRRLTDRRTGGYGQAGYDGWARILRLARKSHPEALLRSVDAALNYALTRVNEPAGAVVAAAFPLVYARLKKDSVPDVPNNLITAMIMLPLSLITDWDKAKSARHGVVDEFLRSKWEPVELLRAGVDAHIPRKILGYLIGRPGGMAYLRRIESGVRSYPEPGRTVLKAALDDFHKSGS